jgi:transcriptional regulator with PAS, ATPase and Fis domain
VPDTLIEAEFFGVAPGAFTGAERRQREGKFKLADGGTLFLDELGDMPLALQAKLLRALQEQEIEALGSNEVQRIDVRVIAATSRDLQALVDAASFRADLFYRLNVLPIRVPALRERLADLDALAESLLEQIATRSGMPQRELTPAALHLLATHEWPGNVRELRNTLEQAAMLTDELRLDAAHFVRILQAAPRGGAHDMTHARTQPPSPLPQRIAELERESIRSALAATGGNKVSAAKLLGISRATLYEKLAAMRAAPPDFS